LTAPPHNNDSVVVREVDALDRDLSPEYDGVERKFQIIFEHRVNPHTCSDSP
jgi:hypothetical protein